MNLSPDDRAKLEKFVKNCKLSKCPICDTDSWSLSEQVYQLTEYPEAGRFIGKTIAPLVPLTCTKCGNTILFNALIAGVNLKGQHGG
jgi:hypothetical protein